LAPAPSPEDHRLRPIDLALVLLLLVCVAGYVHAQVDLGGRPEEDAAMLLRYSKHLAEGRGIVWNMGEPPVDGATDFLFMAAVATVHRFGPSLEGAAQGIGLLAHALTAVLIFLGIRTLFGGSCWLALVPTVFFAVGPGLRHLAACYGTPLFTLTAAVSWLLAVRLARGSDERLDRWLFALSVLAMGLARPEGVFLGGFFLLGALYARGGVGARPILAAFLGVFLTLGLAYFLWRWHYFGYPLPNPFYKKGAGVLHLHSLRQSLRDLGALGLPFVALLPIGLLRRPGRRLSAAALLAVLAFVVLWVLISDETNYVMRFRAPILPVVLTAWVPAWQGLVERVRVRVARQTPVWVGAAMALLASAGFAAWQHGRYHYVAPQRMGLYDAAVMLREYAQRDYSLVTSEAGLLPLYSTWRAVDAWGLNDRFIAHHGEVTDEYLDRYRPEVIVFHAYFSPGVPQDGPRVENRSLGPRWYRMVMTLKAYAERNGYVLAACFGRNAWDTHWYYVRAGFLKSAEIVARIRALDYYWDGEPTVDFTAEGRSLPGFDPTPLRSGHEPSREDHEERGPFRQLVRSAESDLRLPAGRR
jgi:arabinofuranosyltransferase